ncbi:unnamed protein product [Camellia sinensis]
MMASRKLAHYFHAHTIVVLTEFPLKTLFEQADFSGRILKWAVELGKFDIKFQPQTAIKAQALADFVAEFSPGIHPVCPMDLTAAAGVNEVSAMKIAQQSDVGDAELARPSTNPSVGGALQPDNTTLDLGIIGQLVGSNAASPRGDDDASVEIISSKLVSCNRNSRVVKQP